MRGNLREIAQERAERSVKYSDIFPHLIRAGEEVFQSAEWQLEQLTKYHKQSNKEPEESNKGDLLDKVVRQGKFNKAAYQREYMSKRRANSN